MSKKWRLAIPISVLALVVALGSLAIADSRTPEVSSQNHIGPDRPDPRQRFVDAAVDHPGGFGGWYIEDEIIHVYLKDPSTDPRAAFNEMYNGAPPDMPIVAVQANHSYDELYGWAREINEANKGYVTLSSENIQLDLNRILYGVLTVEEIEPAIAWIESLGVPRTAFEVRLDSIQPETGDHGGNANSVTEGTKWAPVVGGVPWEHDWGSTSDCTIGFVAKKDGVKGFVTASHCAQNSIGGVQNIEMHQPSKPFIGGPDHVGDEAIDPTATLNLADPYGQCPLNGKCRYSDAAWYEIRTGHDGHVGEIARPTAVGQTDVDNGAWFEITKGSFPHLNQGQHVFVIGRTSGWQTATVDDDCVRKLVDAANSISVVCMVRVNYNSGMGTANGDSGGPWLTWMDEFNDEVNLLGVHWGSGSGQALFSPIGGVLEDIDPNATWEVCVSAAGC